MHECGSMAFSDSLRSNILIAGEIKVWSPKLNVKQKRLAIKTAFGKRGQRSLSVINSVLNSRRSSFSSNEDSEPARVLLERLFAQTQKLEEQMNRDSHRAHDSPQVFDLESLEFDLLAALSALTKKEEDLHDAEKTVMSENTELNLAKEKLNLREVQYVAACSKQVELEEALENANLNLASQARQITDLENQLRGRAEEISTAQSALCLKENELNKLRTEFVKKSEEAAMADSELKLKARLLDEAYEVIKKQEIKIQELRKDLVEKKEELGLSVANQRAEKENLHVAEANLEKHSKQYLTVQSELKKMAENTSIHLEENNKTLKDFQSVRNLLTDVRSELVASQKYLVSSRQKMADQEQLLENQLDELGEQRRSVISYMTSLKEAQIEVEGESVKLRVAEARNKELEQDLYMEKNLTEKLHGELKKEKAFLLQSIQEMSFLHDKLNQKTAEISETQNLLRLKESELVEAKLEIQHLKSEQAALQSILKEKDLELFNANRKYKELNEEVTELKMLMNSKENQLVQATSMLKEKEEHVQTMEHELNTTKMNFWEAETVVQRIVDLTNKLVLSIKHEQYDVFDTFDKMGQMQAYVGKPGDEKNKWDRNKVETELELVRDSLRTKELEVLASQRNLAVKDTELEMVLERLNERENELKKLKEEMVNVTDDLKKLYATVEENIGDTSIGGLVTEKLKLETSQLEVEAATSALYKLAEMSRELSGKASSNGYPYTPVVPVNHLDPKINVGDKSMDCLDPKINVGDKSIDCLDPKLIAIENNESINEIRTRVVRLSALTEQLVREAGIANMDMR